MSRFRDWTGKITAPKRPYRNLADFRARTLWSGSAEAFFKENPHKWPCLHCSGIGIIYDPDDPPCPVEGNKMRNRIKCSQCGGTRCGSKEDFAKVYREKIQAYLKVKAEYEALVKARRSGLKKLTQEERTALSELGL